MKLFRASFLALVGLTGLAVPAFAQYSYYPYGYAQPYAPQYVPVPILTRPLPYPPAAQGTVPRAYAQARPAPPTPYQRGATPPVRERAIPVSGSSQAETIIEQPTPKDAAPSLPVVETVGPVGDPFAPTPSNLTRGWMGGAGLYYVRPFHSSSPAFVTTVNQTAVVPNTTHSQERDFSWGYHSTPKLWLGYFGDCGWGGQVTYWRFQGSPDNVTVTHPADPAGTQTFGSTLGALPIPVRSNFPPTAPDFINIRSSLGLSVFDAEVAKVGGWDRTSYKASFGGRYASLSQSYNASLTNANNPPNFFQSETNTFRGAGPTVGGLLSYRIFGNVSMYGDGRFSLLLGRSQQQATQVQTGIVPGQSLTSSNSRDMILPVGELEFGLSCQRTWNRLNFVLKTGVTAQMWWDAGSATTPAGGVFSSVSGQALNLFPVTNGSNSNLGFVGLTTSLGIRY